MSNTWEVDGNFETDLELTNISDIKSTGLSIRVGNQIVKFVADDVQDIPVNEEVENELRAHYKDAVDTVNKQWADFKTVVQEQVRQKNQELDVRERELNEKAKQVVTLPVLNANMLQQGLTVAKNNGNGYMWSYICVYAPKYVNDKIIDPVFAKRLMTPIRIFVTTDDNWKATRVKLVKLINCEKFEHYHSLSGNRDCWGGMKYSGILVDTPESALKFMHDVQIVLETVNEMSIGNRAPKGLSRFTTLTKHLLKERHDPQNDKRSTVSRRNDRSGFDATVNDSVSENLWDSSM